ncbi:hypothetical protein BGW80DRAFT_85163 [Lactifluus volemus]|nr:hypothetical protein BGW80DRAFT_85163 [Lactifluus volemus]
MRSSSSCVSRGVLQQVQEQWDGRRQRATGDLAHHGAPARQGPPGRRRVIESISQTIKRFGDAKSISFILVLLQKKDDYILPGIKRLVSASVYVCALVSFIPGCPSAVALVGLAIGNARRCPVPSVCV